MNHAAQNTAVESPPPATSNPELDLAGAIASLRFLEEADRHSARAGTHPAGYAETLAVAYLRGELEGLAQRPTGTITASAVLRAVQAAAAYGFGQATR